MYVSALASLKGYNVNMHYNKYMQQLYKFISTNIILISRVFKTNEIIWNIYTGNDKIMSQHLRYNETNLLYILTLIKVLTWTCLYQKRYTHHWHIKSILPIIRPHVHKIAQSTHRLKMIESYITTLCQNVACTHGSHAIGKCGKMSQLNKWCNIL